MGAERLLDRKVLSAILAAADLFSEHRNHGQVYGSVQVVNLFLTH